MMMTVFYQQAQKKSETTYKKWLQSSVVIFLSLGFLGLLLSHWGRFSDFASGMLVGMSVSLMLLSIYYSAALRNPRKLHAMYVAAYDERNKQILMATAMAVLMLQFVLVVTLITLYAFFQVQLAYAMVLSLFLYVLLFGFLICRLLFSKLL